jgi:hypothetical protein
MTKLIIYTSVLIIFTGTITYLLGYNHGWTVGFKTGQADTLMQAAGKCFRHINNK